MPDLIDETLSLSFTSKDVYNEDLEINGLSRLLDRNHHQAFPPVYSQRTYNGALDS